MTRPEGPGFSPGILLALPHTTWHIVTFVSELFFTVEQRERRRLGRLVAICGLLVPAVLLGSAVNASYVNVPAVTIIVLLFMSAAAWGVRRAFEAQIFIEVNQRARTCVITERGRVGDPQPLERLAPLTVSLNMHAPRRDPYSSRGLAMSHSIVRVGGRAHPRYEIHPVGRRDLAFFEFRTADQARRKLEALAEAWGVASQAYGGEARQPDALDAALHQRVSRDQNLSTPIALQPQWGLDLQPLAPGYAFTFTRPSPARFISGVAHLVLALVFVGVLYQLDVVTSAISPSDDIAAQIVTIAFVPLLLYLAVKAVVGFLHARPQPLRVTPAGVALGRTTLRFDQIEEVSWVLDVTIGGDRKKLRIPGSWFPAEAGPILVREIKRAIAETAPLAGSRS